VNESLCFKCLHYSVTENSGVVEITIIKKAANQELTFGIRTSDGTAHNSKEYEAINSIMTMKKRENEKSVKITIFDN
jgi:hypothetical protein